MTIPFMQYLRPHGETSSVTIDRPADIEKLAHEFMIRGGRYEAEILTTGEVSLTAVMDDDDIAIEVCVNGPDVVEAVDRLVRGSVAQINGTK